MSPANDLQETSWEDDREHVRDALTRVLPATDALYGGYTWESPLFDVDPYHPLVNLYAVFATMLEREPAAQQLLARVLDEALTEFVTPEARGKLLDAVAAHLESERDLEVREQLRVLAQALRRPSFGLHRANVVVRLLTRDMTAAVEQRLQADDADRERSHPMIEGLIAELTAAEGDDRASVLERLAGFGEEAVPFLARSIFGSAEDGAEVVVEGSPPLLEALGRIGGMRAVERLVHALFVARDEPTIVACAEALAATGRLAVEFLTPYISVGATSAARRLRVYQVFSRIEGVAFAPMALADLDEQLWPPGAFTDAAFERLVDLIVGSDDRRAVPVFIRMLRRKQTPPERKDLLRRRLQKSEWWEEISLALRRLREDKPVFVDREGKSQEQAKGRKKGRKGRGRREELPADEREKLLQEAYHEELGWLRPIDLAPTDSENAKAFEQIAIRDFRAWCLAEGRDSRQPDSWETFQQFWMLEPNPGLDGLTPWAHERRLQTEDAPPPVRERLLQTECDGLYECALNVYARGESEPARKRLRAVLSLLPDHLLAKRLMDRIEGRPPQSTAPRIIIPGR